LSIQTERKFKIFVTGFRLMRESRFKGWTCAKRIPFSICGRPMVAGLTRSDEAVTVRRESCAGHLPTRCFRCCWPPRWFGAAASPANNSSCGRVRRVAAHRAGTVRRARYRESNRPIAHATKSPLIIKGRLISRSIYRSLLSSGPSCQFRRSQLRRGAAAVNRWTPLHLICKFSTPPS
jgi:hypothetical protein